MFKTTIKYTFVIFSTVVVLIAIFFNKHDLNSVDNLTSILDGLLDLERKVDISKSSNKPKVAVGFGACSDLFVEAVHFLNPAELSGEPTHFDDITTKEQLLKSFAYYFRHGAAAERFTSNANLFDELVNIASKSPGAHWKLGGNAPVMASRFNQEGCEVLLGAMMTPKLRKSTHKAIAIAGGEVPNDDVHLILEYKTGETWGNYTTPRANRYILHNDENNPLVNSLEYFDSVLHTFQPRLLVISGLQMMDNFDYQEGVRQSRLNKIQRQMMAQPEKTLVHFEMASFVEADLVVKLTEHVIPFADSVGMNEQELSNLQQTFIYGNVTHVSDSNPRVATSLDRMRSLFSIINQHNKNFENSRSLSRLHVHTLAYQAIMISKSSKANWKNVASAAAKASLVANRHVCASNKIDVNKLSLVMDDSFKTSAVMENATRIHLDKENPVSCWHEEIEEVDCKMNCRHHKVEICVAPVLVCKEAIQTAGAGDNISAAGLVLQL